MTKQNFVRASTDAKLEANKKILESTFEFLKKHAPPSVYASLSAEVRRRKSFSITLQNKNVDEEKFEGVVLRLYDGATLFESASSVLDEKVLHQLALDLVSKLKALGQINPLKPYRSPAWSERLGRGLDPEITTQIPSDVKATTWVHFGTRMHRPLYFSDDQAMAWLTDQFEKLKIKSKVIKPDYSKVSLSHHSDDFIFIDDAVRMSQSIRRNLSRVLITKGEDQGRSDQGGLGGLESCELTDFHFEEAVRKLQDAMKAERLSPGRYSVLMGPAITGVFAHEAFGHTQEGDTWARGRSKAKELFEKGIQVGNQHATIINNPAIYQNGTEVSGAWGSYFFDEEGWLAERQVLVEGGFLKAPMTHLSSSERLGVPRTANAKRENWSHGLYTRQTNTYFSAGDQTLDQMLAKIEYGFLAEECSGGMEDPKGMGIQVGIKYLEEIKNGKKTGRTFKGPNGGAVQMTGYVPDYLNQIEAKSMIDPSGVQVDLEHPWNDVGGCAKYHKEVVYAGCGGPYMLVREVLLG